jgi:hypothetical protein
MLRSVDVASATVTATVFMSRIPIPLVEKVEAALCGLRCASDPGAALI